MAIEQRANNPAVQNSVKSFVFFLRFPFGDHFAIFRKTANMQAVWIRWTATEANVSRRIFFLERLRLLHWQVLLNAGRGAALRRSDGAARRSYPLGEPR